MRRKPKQPATETETETASETETETASETETETESEIDGYLYTAEDDSFSLVLPNSSWRIEKDKKKSAVTFSSGKISVVVRSFDAAKVKEDKFTFPKELKDVEDSLKDSETVYGVEEFAYEEKDGIQTAAYELIPDKNEKDALYGMNFVVMNENEDGFEVTAAVPDEASLEVVQKIVDSFDYSKIEKEDAGETETETASETETETETASETETETETETASETETETASETETVKATPKK